MKLTEAKKLLEQASTELEGGEHKIIWDLRTSDIAQNACMQIKFGTMTPIQAAIWCKDQCTLKNFRC